MCQESAGIKVSAFTSRPAWRALGQRGLLNDRYNLFARYRRITEEEIIDRVTSFDAVE
jgi:hypothetical protein